jgi:hypothetical protein
MGDGSQVGDGKSVTCDSQDLTFHTVLPDGVAVRQDSW